MFSVSNNFAEYETKTETEFANVERQELDERNKRILEIAEKNNYKILDSDTDDNNQYFYDMETKIIYEVLSLDKYDDIDDHPSHIIHKINYIKHPTFTPMTDKKEINVLLTLNAII